MIRHLSDESARAESKPCYMGKIGEGQRQVIITKTDDAAEIESCGYGW